MWIFSHKSQAPANSNALVRPRQHDVPRFLKTDATHDSKAKTPDSAAHRYPHILHTPTTFPGFTPAKMQRVTEVRMGGELRAVDWLGGELVMEID